MSDALLQRSRIAIHVAFVLALAVALGYVAGNQYLGTSRDYPYYLQFFRLVRSSDELLGIDSRFEFGFRALAYGLAGLSLSNAVIYGVICALCVLLKGFAVRTSELSLRLVLVFLFFYLTRYYILFELTVLRGSIAFAIGFFVFWRKKDLKFHWDEFLLLLLAVSFHYSAIVLVGIYFICRLNALGAVVLALSVFLVALFTKHVLFREFETVFPVLASYRGVAISKTIVPIPFMLDMCLIGAALLLWKWNDVPMRCSVIGLAMSVAIHFSMLGYPIIGGRFRELLSLFVLIYVLRAVMSNMKFMRLAAIAFVVVSGALNFYALTIYDPLLIQ